MNLQRVIFHVDMDAFFASIEQLDDVRLRGKPVLVGYDGPRGVVAAASYEARRFGCHSAQPMAVAKRQCPTAVIVPVRMSRYRDVSHRMFAIFDEFSPLVEPLSVDEAFLDLSGCEKLLGPPDEVAARLKQRIRSELHVTASIGMAPNKFLAKLASDLNKPDGLVIIRPEDIDALLVSLPISRLWGVGKVTGEKLRNFGIRTVGDLRTQSPEVLKAALGIDVDRFIHLAHGIDHRPVVSDREAKSIGQEQTFGQDMPHPDDVRPILFEQVEEVGRRLRRHQLHARGISLKIRFGNFETISRSATLKEPSCANATLWRCASELFDNWCRTSFQPIRLIGASAQLLTCANPQMTLFAHPIDERQKKVDALTDQVARKFGPNAIKRGGGII